MSDDLDSSLIDRPIKMGIKSGTEQAVSGDVHPKTSINYHLNTTKIHHHQVCDKFTPQKPPEPPKTSSLSATSSLSPFHNKPQSFVNYSKFLLINLLVSLCPLPSLAAQQTTRHTVAVINGDLVLGALFPVHHAPSPKQAQKRICGEVREQYGIQRVEAAFKTVDEINERKEILPNMKLGIEIRDSCWNSPIALEQSIEFIRDAMAANEERPEMISTNSHGLPSISSTGPDHFSPLSVFMKTALSNEENMALNGGLAKGFNVSMCPRQPHKKVKNIVGVIGPASSSVTIQVINQPVIWS